MVARGGFRFSGVGHWIWIVLAVLTTILRLGEAVNIGIVIGANQPHRVVSAFRDVVQYANQHVPGDRYRIIPHTTRVLDNDTFNVTNGACAHVSSGAAMLVSPDAGTVQEALAAVSDKLHVPLVSTTLRRIPGVRSTRYSLTLRPHAHGALAALVRKYRWPRIYYIYDSTDGLDRLQEILASLPTDQRLDIQHVKRIRGERKAIEFLQQQEDLEWDTEKVIFLDCQLDTARKITQHAYRRRRAYYTFVYTRYTLPQYWKDIQTYDASKVIALKIIQDEADRLRSLIKAANQDSYYSSSEPIPEEEALVYDAGEVIKDALIRLGSERPNLAGELFQRSGYSEVTLCYSTPLLPFKYGQVIAEFLKKTSVNGTT